MDHVTERGLWEDDNNWMYKMVDNPEAAELYLTGLRSCQLSNSIYRVPVHNISLVLSDTTKQKMTGVCRTETSGLDASPVKGLPLSYSTADKSNN